ncbi:MAG: CRR6 family NdhI maturation factor [Aphanocapsa sp. GSE-SYN-MK-11-07L]|jgi:hypothetical protein|nr:CRR6 family NdhI maturation factor [Aphanocapsa sp. GSE-SYN-MK-11-07L]
MTTTIALSPDQINRLDLSPAIKVIQDWLSNGAIAQHEQQLQFKIDYPQDPEDTLELSELPEVRLWFIRLDAVYPWLPYLLDWRAGELARYVAMLVPHQFSPKEGIQYNPQALDIFIMHKIFVMLGWLQSQGIESESKLKAMAEMFGYDLNTGLFELLRAYPVSGAA